MSQDTANMVLGTVILIVAVPALYFAARGFAKLADRWSAAQLAPLAAALGGQTSVDPPRIVVVRAGRTLHLTYAANTSVGTGDSATRMNEFIVDVTGVAGGQSWRALFRVTGLLGQGTKKLQLELQDQALGGRLVDAGLLAEVEAVCSPTTVYAAAAFDARQRRLSVVDDVSPKKLPDATACEHLITLALRVAEINERVNGSPH